MAEKYLSGNCPHCLAKIEYTESDTSVQCNCCDNYVSISELHGSLSVTNRPAAAGGSTQGDMLNTLVLGIETPESGIAYLDHFFLTFDWEEYASSPFLGIEHIENMVEKNKIKNAANAQTWILEFKSISFPLLKKLQGLKKLEQVIVNKYTGTDDTELYSDFDTYSKIIDRLLYCKDNLVKVLVADVQFAEKYGADKATVNELKSQLMKLNQALSSLAPVDKIEDIPAVNAKIVAMNSEIERQLAMVGIDAPSTYNAAVQTYMFNDDKAEALRLFSDIKGYKDANKYINKINRIYNFDNDLFDLAGKRFYAKFDKDQTLDVASLGKKKKKKAAQSNELTSAQKGKTYSLYDVFETIPRKKEFVKGISTMITAYGNNLFYIKNNTKICYYNVVSQIETSIDAANPNDYKNAFGKYEFYFSKDKTKVCLKKKLELKSDKKGCLKSLFPSKKAEDNLNNYQVLVIDVVNHSVATVIPECVDIMEFYDDKVFYSFGYKADDKDDPETYLMVYDLATGARTKVLNTECVIHDSYNGYIIYSTYSPNHINGLLHCYNLATQTEVLLEENFYTFFGIYDNKVYYTVGNYRYESMFSINFDGTERTEIMLNAEVISLVRAGWMYVVKGYGRNRMLLKISLDGKKKFYICNKFKTLVKFANGYLYYIDIDDELHIVRSDGNENKVLADNINADTVVVDSNHIYYTRYETVDDRDNKGYSLYSMDLNGHNIKKIMFDVIGYAEFDENTLYISRDETVTYEVTKHLKKNKEDVSKQVFSLTRYYKFDKLTEELEVIMNVGLPDPEEEVPGCLGRKKKIKVSYRELPTKYDYTRYDRAQVGENYEKQTAAGTNNKNNPLGCLNKNGKNKKQSGCAPKGNNKKQGGCAPKGNNKKQGCAPKK